MPDAVIRPGTARLDPPYVSGERESLDAWLDYHRATLLMKCEGLDGERLAERSCPPSSLSLLGLVRHMTDVERHWFRRGWQPAGPVPLYWSDEHPDGDFDLVDPDGAAGDVDVFLAEVDTCRAEAVRHALDDTLTHRREGVDVPIDLRWIYVHMIEEYARHNGHADLLRERIDGVTGD